MKKLDWGAVLAKLEVVGGPIRPVQRAVLRRYEKNIGMSLPEGYKGFCQTIGPGELTVPRHYRIHAPRDPLWDIESLNQDMKNQAPHRDQLLLDIRGTDRSQLVRGVYFASDITTICYFWDPEDLTDPDQHEYGIYAIYRDHSVRRVCDNYWEFVNTYCLGESDIMPVFITALKYEL
jgi:hypothetical protein